MSETKPRESAKTLTALAPLNERQRRFVREMVKGSDDITTSAITAGYSEDSAHMQGSRLLKNDKIQAAITECRQDAEKAARVTADKVVGMMGEIALDKTHKDCGRMLDSLTRVLGIGQGTRLNLTVGHLQTLEACDTAQQTVLSAVTSGDLDVDAAEKLNRLVADRRDTIWMLEVVPRLEAVEQALEQGAGADILGASAAVQAAGAVQ